MRQGVGWMFVFSWQKHAKKECLGFVLLLARKQITVLDQSACGPIIH